MIRRTLLNASAVFALGAASLGASAQTMVLKAADVHPAGYPNVVAVESMGKKLETCHQWSPQSPDLSGWRVGGEKEMIEQTQVGAINILRTSLGPVGTVVPEVNVFNLPFIFRSQEHARGGD